jgi:hypothetical protein
MSRIEKTTCDACGAEIPEDKVRLQVDCVPTLVSYALDPDERVRRVAAESELRELLKTKKDFCDLECLARWAIAQSAQSRVKQHRAHLGE